MHFLLDLPAILLTGVFTDWLDLPALVALDSASCSAESRKAYLNVVTSKETCFHQLPSPPVLHSNGVQWFVTRGAKIKRVVIEFTTSAVDVALFFERSAGSLKSLRIDNKLKYSDEYFAMQIRDYENGFSTRADLLRILPAAIATHDLRHLHTLVIVDCGEVDGNSLGALLARCSKTLKRFSIERCEVYGPLDISQLPSFQMLHISTNAIDTKSVCQLITSSPDLRSFHCSNLHKKDDYFNALATHCPLLQVLSYGRPRPSVASLVRVLHDCPAIEVVNMYCLENVRDVEDREQHYAAIMTHCAQLKAFGAGDQFGSIKFTRAELMAIATGVKNLRHLYLYSLGDDEDTADGIRAMAPHGGNLKSVELRSNSNLDCNVLTAVVRNLHNIEELCIYSNQDDDVLEAIAANCPLLRVLNLQACGGYTEKGLAAVALKCTAMELLSYSDDEGVLSPFGELMWKAMRPEMQFHDYGAHCSVWENLLDVERDELVIW